jgi:hypothetical protein
MIFFVSSARNNKLPNYFLLVVILFRMITSIEFSDEWQPHDILLAHYRKKTNYHVYMNIVGGKHWHRHRWKKAKKQQDVPSEPALAPPNSMLIERAPIRVGMGSSIPPSGGTLSESSDGRDCPPCPRSKLRLSSIISDSLTVVRRSLQWEEEKPRLDVVI